MARAPIDVLMDRLEWKCCACGTPRSQGCTCLLESQCPSCRKTTRGLRLPTEPKEAVLLRLYCLPCLESDPPDCLPAFLDAEGREIPVDLEAWAASLPNVEG